MTYKIQLQNYFGPLDLLLYLVKEEEIDIIKVKLAKVADQYIAFIKAAEALDIDVSNEFIEIISQLMLIKSRAVVPSPQESEQEPSIELIQRLLEFSKVKETARMFERLCIERSERFSRAIPQTEIFALPEEYTNLDLWRLSTTFAKLTRQLKLDISMKIIYQDTPIEEVIGNILLYLMKRKTAEMFDMIKDKKNRLEIINVLLAILQLVRDGRVDIRQMRDDKRIVVRLL